MKKFLRKKPVMIAFIIAAIVFLAVEIGILVRPVSYGLNYVYNSGDGIVKFSIRSDSTARVTITEDEEKTILEMWIYRDGHDIKTMGIKKYISITGATKAEIEDANKHCKTRDKYKAEVEELKELKKNDENAYTLAMAFAQEFGIFEAKMGDEVAKCPQAIVFVSVHGAVTLALFIVAGMAIAYSVKKK